MRINWNNAEDRVSEYFTVREVTMGDVRRKPVNGSDVERSVLKLAKRLDVLRKAWGSAIGVTSWYRPPYVNSEVGGVLNSQHILGSAADIYTLDGRDGLFESWLDTQWGDFALGYGVRSGLGFTHVDLRHGRIRWDY